MLTMKKIILLPVLVAMISVVFFSTQTVVAADSLDLTGVNSFAILANTYTNSGTGIVLNGDLGYYVAHGSPPTVSGTIFPTPAPTYLSAITAQSNLLASVNNPAKSGACTTTRSGATVLDDLPQPLTPGVYCIGGAAYVNTAGIVLNGDGVYIFRINGALDTVANSHVVLTGNAKSNNVFWVPTGGTTLGANSVFAGNIVTNAATTMGSTVSMNGRILSNGAVTTTGPDTIAVPSGATLIPIPPKTPTPATIQDSEAPSSPPSKSDSDGTIPTDQVFSYKGSTGTSIFSSQYIEVAPTVGVVNKAVFKIYEKAGPGEIRHLDLVFGVAEGQIFSDSRIMVQWDKTWNGIETTKVIDPEHALTNVRVETSRGSCDVGVAKNDCLIVELYHTLTAPVEFNTIATNVSDRISSLSYWSGYDRNDLLEFNQLRKDQVLIAKKLWDSSKIQTHMPVITDTVQYSVVDNRDTIKFAQMKKDQALIAKGKWDSSKIQDPMHDKSTPSYFVDTRDTLAFEKLKKSEALIAKGIWDSSAIQNPHTPEQSVSPATMHCLDNGGKIKVQGTGKLMQSICVFPDGSQCEEGKYFRGECYPKKPQ
ncbi:ice-binding family protein [Candidatus Nitrosotenuis chungbukensis]|uniref:ice-binding family protein n=1 Tax=Candidatus Nitrosotenuis chungbukensis TaxID=1353246 RepID=UPI0009DFA289|nr:ice-binding family protein [Candidatus Nitrosotenuis chungbukensis]